MKSLTKYSIAIAFILFSFSIGNAQNKKIKGNGNVTTKTHTTENYEQVNLVGFMDVYLEAGTEGTITVTTDENVQEYVIVEVKNGKLTLKIKKGVSINTKKGVHITVPFTDINNVTLTGSGDVITKSPINSINFETELTGSGDMVLEVNATTIDAKITGSGDIKLNGKTTDLDIKVTGSGDFSGRGLSAQKAEAYVSGSGDIIVMATSSIKARVHGSGDIVYYGNPANTDTKVMGSGDIESH